MEQCRPAQASHKISISTCCSCIVGHLVQSPSDNSRLMGLHDVLLVRLRMRQIGLAGAQSAGFVTLFFEASDRSVPLACAPIVPSSTVF